MAPEKLTRTSYRDEDGDPRDGDAALAESRRDMEEHLQPLLRVHASALHGAGVATGLPITATTGGTTIAVGPGVAVDTLGRHISLAPGGRALLGTNPEPVEVKAAGIVLDLTTLTPGPGPHHLTLTFAETFDALAHASSGGTIFELDHTPRLALQPADTPTDPAVVLARVTLAADTTVTALDPGPRQACPTPTGDLTVAQPQVRPDPTDPNARTVAGQPAGRLTAHPDGGLTLRSPHTHTDGPLSVHGVLTADGPLSVHGALTADGPLTALAGLTVDGPLAARGPLTVGDGLTVTGLGPAPALRVDPAPGRVGVGVAEPGRVLDVAGQIRLRQATDSSAGLWLHQTRPGADRAFVGMFDDNWVGFWGEAMGRWGLRMDTRSGFLWTQGTLRVDGEISVAKTGGEERARLTNQTYDNEGELSRNNLKLVMATNDVGPPERFQFAIGAEDLLVDDDGTVVQRRFRRRFSVDQDGNAFFAGSKGGYVVDYAVNSVGDTLERGDVVVLRDGPPAGHYGTDDAVPIPEIDLTDRPYDGRVCGVVADVVPANDLPTHRGPGAAAGLTGSAEDQPRTEVRDRQVCRIVTLGAWAYCKVDADAAPVGVGDLLTTAATRGHAQKVVDPGGALGTVLGKAMAPLPAGRGVIPVLVTLQ